MAYGSRADPSAMPSTCCSTLRRRALLGGITLLGLLASSAQAVPIDPSSATVGWTPIAYASVLPDAFDDQATGIPEADIVGNTSNPAFYCRFDDAGTPATTDGAIAFRVRLGADTPPSGYERFVCVGFDANLDGALDLFLSLDNTGSRTAWPSSTRARAQIHRRRPLRSATPRSSPTRSRRATSILEPSTRRSIRRRRASTSTRTAGPTIS
jgi:hypothetical protein